MTSNCWVNHVVLTFNCNMFEHGDPFTRFLPLHHMFPSLVDCPKFLVILSLYISLWKPSTGLCEETYYFFLLIV
jgi:hypothetical protein